ncbi:sensor histidine kinase [Bacteroidota bacterium]
MRQVFVRENEILKTICLNTLTWLFLIALVTVLGYYDSEETLKDAIRLSLPVIVPFIIPVYFHYYIFNKFFNSKKYLYYVVILVLLIYLGGFFIDGFNRYLFSADIYMKESRVNLVLFLLVSTGIKYYRNNLKSQIKLHKIEAQKNKAELELLKSQINPHFLFNTLNNIYSLARKNSDQTSAIAIAKLSHLMRYVLYECSYDFVDLQNEIEQIESFIKLQKLRFSEEDNIKINFEYSGTTEGKLISPMLLLPFVENAFKHGISFNNKSYIDIQIKSFEKEFKFMITNSVYNNKNSKDGDSGIGLVNVKKRLQLIYPDKHILKINSTKDEYSVFLELKV